MGSGKLIEKHLQAVAVGGGQFQHEGVARVGLHGPAEPEVLEGLLKRAEWLDSTQGQPAACDGVQAKAALILRPQAEVFAWMGGLHRTQLLLQALLAESGEFGLFF